MSRFIESIIAMSEGMQMEQSILINKSHMTEPSITAENLNLVLRLAVHQPRSMKEVFTRALSSPLETLARKKDRLHVLQNVNFKIQKGERIGILGVNGSGKTTLCRTIAGYYKPASGKIKVQGNTRAIFSTSVGVMPELTGYENAELLAALMYPHVQNKKALVQEALEFSELGSFIYSPVRHYSSGMQTRLCLSLVSAMPSEILVLDEVFDGADQFFKTKVEKRILTTISQSGIVVFVSHSAGQVLKVCTRVLVLHQNKVAFDGTPEDGVKFYEELRK
jgi:ABC-type polysaccharide/polyol phosphate transport system ATPase subunit